MVFRSQVDRQYDHDAGAESSVKPVDGVETKAEDKSIVFGSGDTKSKKAAEAAKEGEQTLPESSKRRSACGRIR